MSGRSTPRTAMVHSRIDGEERRITALLNSGDTRMTRRRSRTIASIYSGDRLTCHLTPNRPQCCVTTSLPRAPVPRDNSRPRQPCSSTPSSLSERSSGLRPRAAAAEDVLVARDVGLCRFGKPREVHGERHAFPVACVGGSDGICREETHVLSRANLMRKSVGIGDGSCDEGVSAERG
jgi:hypothetical protein